MSGSKITRRRFLASIPTSAAAVTMLAHDAAADDSSAHAIYFPLSYLYCTPTDSGIVVRVQAECVGRVIDLATNRADEYVMGVVAKTGLTLDAKGRRTPGYDYWIIFSKSHVFTRRSHASSYASNPTTLTHAQFGEARWRLCRAAAEPLHTAADVRRTLMAGLPMTAVTRFHSTDGQRCFEVEYPVKWADCGVERDQMRVETGPVVMLDPDEQAVGQVPRFDQFQWAHFDYHDLKHVRCLLDRPVSIFVDAAFVPPSEHGRENRANPALTEAQVRQIRDRLMNGWEAPLPPDKMDELLSTDHYSQVVEREAETRLYAFNFESLADPDVIGA